jgi:diguanylate cyclase (GGDEF)-like protein/PAS domain S-box-containing protein
LEFLCIPPMLWIAYRFGPRETATANFLLSAIALWGTLHGFGPFVLATPNDSLILLQVFMGVISVMGLILSSLVAERDRGLLDLQKAKDILEERVVERTRSLTESLHVQRDSEERFRLLIETVRDYAIFMLDPNGIIISWNAGAERIKGYTLSEILGKHFSVFYPEEDIARGVPAENLNQAVRDGQIELEAWRVRKDGSRFWGFVVITALRDRQGNLRGFAKITRDITERMEAERKIQVGQARFRQLMDSNIIGFMLIDERGQLIEANNALLKLLGCKREDLSGDGLSVAAITPDAYRPIDEWIEQRLRSNGVAPPTEKEFLRKDGSRVAVLVGAVRLEGQEGQQLCFVIDVNERRLAMDALRKSYDELETIIQQRTEELQEEIQRRLHAEQELRQQALHDPLTGLYNRRGFATIIEPLFDLTRRQGKIVQLFMADLDDLKQINDRFGHAEGDQAIQQAAKLLRDTFRKTDVIARIGGDEFAIFAVGEPSRTPDDILQRLTQVFDDHNRYSGKLYALRLSVGAAVSPTHGLTTLEDLMKTADNGLYEKKKRKSKHAIKGERRAA